MQKTKKSFKTACVIAVSLLLFLCLLTGCKQNQTAQGTSDAVFREETISYRNTEKNGNTEEWQWWTDYLVSTAAEDVPYAFAFIYVGDHKADFSWGFYDDRESFVTDFSEKKSGMDMNPKDDGSIPWYFVKLRMDDGIYGADIYEYMQQNLSEEGYKYEACTLDSGRLYVIFHTSLTAWEEEYSIWANTEAVICDGYMYLLACKGADEENIEEIDSELARFETQYHDGYYRTGTIMDEDALYWSDHMQRVTELENPQRIFTEERATDIDNPDRLMGYFGLLRKAEYQIKLAPDMPEMMISFQFAEEIPEEGYETYLFNGSSMDETYQMEIRNVEDNSLIQTTDVNLCIERTDTISFEDIDGDGYLEMNIVYPTHWSGDDEIEVDHRAYWTWDREKNELVQGKGQTASNREDVPEANSTFILVTVEQGDCLWNLAVEYYGDGRKWTEIYEWNQATIGDDPSLIYEGMILNLPWETDDQLFTIP